MYHHSDIKQAIKYLNATIQHAVWESTPSSDAKEHHISTSIRKNK
jgi:hypothetical protein